MALDLMSISSDLEFQAGPETKLRLRMGIHTGRNFLDVLKMFACCSIFFLCQWFIYNFPVCLFVCFFFLFSFFFNFFKKIYVGIAYSRQVGFPRPRYNISGELLEVVKKIVQNAQRKFFAQ
jgi:hypothetical protein